MIKIKSSIFKIFICMLLTTIITFANFFSNLAKVIVNQLHFIDFNSMLFNSYSFLFGYLPIVLFGFFTLSRLHLVKAAKSWLFLASLFFYAYWDIRFLPLLLGSICFNYQLGQLILSSSDPSRKKFFVLTGVIGDLSLLFYFKYYNFFLSVFLLESFNLLEVILPLGISFFTFTQIAYLVDVYQEKANKCDLISYGLFVTIFPHLIAGPILHHKEMTKQFDHLRMFVVSWPHLAQGTFLFIMGLTKKVLIADNLVGFVKPIFDQANGPVPFIQAWLGALSYTLQLYFDFSGYSDMALGLGLLFNLKLPINFNSPYQATSLIDFWRRWHMTLSKFLRDYLYIGLGGNRHGKWAKMRNLFLTMLLGGLWHGAGWTFVLWGACHGAFLTINHVWRDLKFSMPNWLARTLTLLAVICTWVIFRSPHIEQAFNILGGMMGLNGIALPESYAQSLAFLQPFGIVFQHVVESRFRLTDLAFISILSLIVLFLPNSNEWLERFKQRPLAWAVPCALALFVCILKLDEMAEFLYYQF